MVDLSKIYSSAYKGQAVDLLDALPDGPVGGYHANNLSKNQSWTFIHVAGNEFKFKNGTTGTYARIPYEGPHAPVVGGNEYVWKLVPRRLGTYQISTVDGEYVWRLTGPNDYSPIVLQKTPYEEPDALWVYLPDNQAA